MTERMIAGTQIQLDGKQWTIPPLTVRQRLALEPELATIREQPITDPAVMRALVKVAWTAMRRNYPDLSEDDLLDALDMSTLAPAYLAALTGPPGGGPVSVAPMMPHHVV